MPSECLSSDSGCTSCTSQLCACRPIKEKHIVAPVVLSVVTQPAAPPTLPAQSTSNQLRSSRHHSHQHTITIQSPSPLTDITRLRVRPQPHYCLYPGARFEGSQKSGPSSYEVSVTLTDIDLGSSHLCGYLSIKGLTDDYPELTTYFDADVIGEQHGFRTENWGATEGDDITHWNRFPAFRHVRSEMKRPRLTIPDRDRGAVFMRWKEKFVVPDHKLQDINGASFAGAYHRCMSEVYRYNSLSRLLLCLHRLQPSRTQSTHLVLPPPRT